MNVLIIPDVHGRPFWEDAVEKHKNDCDKIVFLGDYLDPYGYEGIDYANAMSNFVKIINFASGNRERVVLLLGNHDVHYISRSAERSTRYSWWHSNEIREVFNDDIDMFKVAYECEINNKRFLFTHAGVTKSWYDKYEKIIGELSADNLNKLIEGVNKRYDILTEVGISRGGWSKTGGPTWADVTDHLREGEGPFDGIYQIFGHTQLRENPYITDNFACLDCRRAFILNNEGKIVEL